MTARCDIAIVGAASLRGTTLLEALGERPRRFGRKYLLDSSDRAGMAIAEDLGEHELEALDDFDFARVSLVFLLTDDASARQRALAAGCRLIDLSGRVPGGDEPVVVVEPDESPILPQGVLISPSPAAVAVALALRPLQALGRLESVVLSSLQSVSGGGTPALEELGRQTAALLNFQPLIIEAHPAQIAFNLLPAVGAVEPGESSRSEREIVVSLGRLLGPEAPELAVTTVQVPVFYGDLQLVTVRGAGWRAADARRVWEAQAGIRLVESELPTPVGHASDSEALVIGRLRDEPGLSGGFSFCVLADNMRRVGVDNAVRIAECLVADN